jgi:hypothetical protein
MDKLESLAVDGQTLGILKIRSQRITGRVKYIHLSDSGTALLMVSY